MAGTLQNRTENNNDIGLKGQASWWGKAGKLHSKEAFIILGAAKNEDVVIELIFLGTSSATPTARRNVSSLALQFERESWLVDVGEGTQLQILRSGMRRGRIDRIFITHLHGDHFYGLIGLLSSFQLNKREEALQILGPPGLRSYLKFMRELAQTDFSYEIDIVELGGITEPCQVLETADLRVSAARLKHRVYTLGYRIEEKDRPGQFDEQKARELGIPFGPERGRLIRGESIELASGKKVEPAEVVGPPRAGSILAICTDTAYCQNAVHLAQDADLLIHEATYDPGEREQARRTRHSTVLDALRVARSANVRHLALTHFSTRYLASMEPFEQALREEQAEAILARDFLQLRLHADSEELELGDSRNRTPRGMGLESGKRG